METKVATAIASGEVRAAARELTTQLADQLGGRVPVLIAAFASTQQPLGEVLCALEGSFPMSTVIGASSAGEFTEHGDRKGSVTAIAVAGDFAVRAGMASGLSSDPEAAVSRAVKDLPQELDGYRYRTAILLVDPLAGNGEEVTLIASTLLGADVRLAGGAAGDDLKMAKTHVGLGGRAESDAVMIALIFSNQPLGVGVSHGHVPLSDPLKVTRASGATVHEVDGRPAWDVWAERTRASAAARGVDPSQLPSDAVGGFLLRYEAGLSTGGGQYKIRAPLSRGDDGSLSFACGIPEGATVQIMEGEPKTQVHSARAAARSALSQTPGVQVAGAIVFDCICRNLILGSEFGEAVSAMASELGDVPLAGFETYGEIALDAGDMSGFHNTTSVVLTFPK